MKSLEPQGPDPLECTVRSGRPLRKNQREAGNPNVYCFPDRALFAAAAIQRGRRNHTKIRNTHAIDVTKLSAAWSLSMATKRSRERNHLAGTSTPPAYRSRSRLSTRRVRSWPWKATNIRAEPPFTLAERDSLLTTRTITDSPRRFAHHRCPFDQVEIIRPIARTATNNLGMMTIRIPQTE